MTPPAREVVLALDEHPPPVQLRVQPLHRLQRHGARPVGGARPCAAPPRGALPCGGAVAVSAVNPLGHGHVPLVQLGEHLEVGRKRRPVRDAARLLGGGRRGAQAGVPRGGGRLERRGLLQEEDERVALLEQRAPAPGSGSGSG